MRYTSQNLNEGGKGSIWSCGRAWIYTRNGQRDKIRLEWYFGKHSRSCRLGIDFGEGDGDDGITIALCLPFLFSFYFSVDGLLRCKSVQIGASIHDSALWIKTLSWTNEFSTRDPWYRKGLHFNFPWGMRHYRTEILDPNMNVVFIERSHRLNDFHERLAVAKSVSTVWPYRYVLKSGEVQERTATIHIVRMEWRARWYPIIWRRKVRTCIDVQFSDEVGEGAGSWKGGCIGCGYDMLPGESAADCLFRMERELKFTR